VVALASWLGRTIARSVGRAARAAIASGEGGARVQRGTPVTEVNTLMAELQETANLLRESKDRLQIAMDAAQLGRWQYGALRHVVSGDTRFKEILDIRGAARRGYETGASGGRGKGSGGPPGGARPG
jgi:PAS domain-containing protein